MSASLALPKSETSLPADEARELRLERQLSALECRKSLRAWCIEAQLGIGHRPARHHKLLIERLEALAAGTIDRLMVMMPPGSAKSTYASILFPPWFLIRGNADIIGASHGAGLAEEFSGKVLRMIQEHGPMLGYGVLNESAESWRTNNGGAYRAAGAGGSITGRRADLCIIDDPIKGREDADSQVIRDKVWAWYRAEVITRLKPGGRIVLINTRWHEDDLAGRLLAEMKTGGDRWEVLNLPALAEADDPLGRAPGEPLWPEWESLVALERKRDTIGPREWGALFQQHPRPLEGALFKVGNIQVLDVAPQLHGATIARGWDLAATKQVGTNNPDWTAGVKLARMPSGLYVVLDVMRFRGGPDDVDNTIRNIASQDGKTVKIGLPQDPGQAGKQQVLAFTRLLSGHDLETSPETGDKATRAAPVASQVNGNNVAIVRAGWNSAFIEELRSFPSGAKDDQVDGLSRAFSLVGLGARPLVVSDRLLAALGQR